MMKRDLRLFIAIVVSLTCLSCNNKKGIDSENDKSDSLRVAKIDKIVRQKYQSLRLYAKKNVFLDDEGNMIIAYCDNAHNIHLFDNEGCLMSEENDSPRTITLHTKGNLTYNAFIDHLGNAIVYDSSGNVYNFYTDDFGNTTGYDSDGNIYQSFTDGFGNTTGYDSDGNIYQSFTDDFGNTTTYGPDGEIYQSFTDDFGNTTTYGPDGEIYQSFTDDFGNTTIYGD